MSSPLLMTVILLLGLMAMMYFQRSQQKRMLTEQKRRTEEALVPGNWVRTRAGFYGTVVEVSGDVVTLATPLGDESLWAKAAIVGAEEPPFATDEENEGAGEAEESEAGDDPAESVADSDADEARA